MDARHTSLAGRRRNGAAATSATALPARPAGAAASTRDRKQPVAAKPSAPPPLQTKPLQSMRRTFGTIRSSNIQPPQQLARGAKPKPRKSVPAKPPVVTEITKPSKRPDLRPEVRRSRTPEKKTPVAANKPAVIAPTGEETPYLSAQNCSKCRLDRFESATYWLQQIRLAEDVGKHSISAEFFRLAFQSHAQPILKVEIELRSYIARHNSACASVSLFGELLHAGRASNSAVAVGGKKTVSFADEVEACLSGEDILSGSCQQCVEGCMDCSRTDESMVIAGKKNMEMVAAKLDLDGIEVVNKVRAEERKDYLGEHRALDETEGLGHGVSAICNTASQEIVEVAEISAADLQSCSISEGDCSEKMFGRRRSLSFKVLPRRRSLSVDLTKGKADHSGEPEIRVLIQ